MKNQTCEFQEYNTSKEFKNIEIVTLKGLHCKKIGKGYD